MYGPRGSITNNELPWINQMAQLPESLNMDRRGITFSKKNSINISKHFAIGIFIAFILCIIITGLVTHFLTACAVEERYDKQHATEIILDEHTDATTKLSSTIADEIESITTINPFTSVTDSEAQNNTIKRNVRLPTNIIPQNYDLRILTFMHNFTFDGNVRINIEVLTPTINITLHSNKLNISCDEVTVVNANNNDSNESIAIQNCTVDTSLEFYVIYLENEINPGFYNVSLHFLGELNDELSGYYRSSYKAGNTTRWVAATQFQATDARKAFPCFDEPALKATFQITIGRPNNYSTISNMPLKYKQPHETLDEYTWDEFERSVPMSTYLVAYIVSDFKSKRIGNFALYARESALNQTEVAANLGPKFLKYFEEFFDVPFPLPKMDLAAIPDFSAGAMENWGLITFRESNLLYEEGVSSKRNLQRIAIVIAHELGHQWFGNLVTPSWWTDLWLNEGFASYLEFLGTNAVHPEWKMMDQFVVEDLQSSFALDALNSSHPISVVVNNPNEIDDIFDRISYEKGATIIRMMEDFLTTNSFRRGLKNYLNEMKYKSAQQDDLWAALTDQAQKDKIFESGFEVKHVMDTWTLQMGYPLITINRTSEIEGKLMLNVSQEKFSLDKSLMDDYAWWVPLTYTTKSGNISRTWMSNTNKTIQLEIDASSNDWLLFNVNQMGYYRVNYDAQGWELLRRQLLSNYSVFDPKNRAQIMNDALSLASAGYLNYTTALNLTQYLRTEHDFVPWKAAAGNLQYILDMFQRSGHFDILRDYLLSLIQPNYKKMGFADKPTDPLLVTYLREIILSNACRLGLPKCIQEAATAFENWMLAPNPDEINSISPNLKGIVYCTAVEIGGERMWKFLWQRFLNANVGSERELLITSLGCTREPWLLNKYMTMAITPHSGIKKQDVIFVFRAVGKNIVGQSIGFRFVTSNWDQINKYIGKSIVTANGILTAVTNNMNTEKELEELKTFAKKYENDETFSQRNARQIIEQTSANIFWMSKYFNEIVEWLRLYSKSV